MTEIVIRQAGAYTVTHDGLVLRCNGRQTSLAVLGQPRALSNGRTIVAMVDAQARGANGRLDQVGITAEEFALVRQASRAHVEAGEAAYARAHAAEIAAADADARLARAYDRGMNEGATDGFNPYDPSRRH